MANTLKFFMEPDDEKAFFHFLGTLHLEVYPRRVPVGWKAYRADETVLDRIPEDDLYLAATEIGPVLVDKVKRGPDKGHWRVDEVRSPVIYYERCRINEDGELVAGRLWAEMDVTPQTGRRDPAPDRFRKLAMEVEQFFKKRFRKGDRAGFFVGPQAARSAKAGLVLRDSGHRGETVSPYK